MALDSKMPKEVKEYFDFDGAVKMNKRLIDIQAFQRKQVQIGTAYTVQLEENYRKLLEEKAKAQDALAKEMETYKALRDCRRGLQQQLRDLQQQQHNAREQAAANIPVVDQRPNNNNSTNFEFNGFRFNGSSTSGDGKAPLPAGFKTFDELFGPERDKPTVGHNQNPDTFNTSPAKEYSSAQNESVASVGSRGGGQMRSQAVAGFSGMQQKETPSQQKALEKILAKTPRGSGIPFFSQRSSTPRFDMGNKQFSHFSEFFKNQK